MRDPHEVAQAFVKEARDDLEVAELLLNHQRFSKCLQHAQSAVEKILKAALVLRGQVVTEHRVAALFLTTFRDAVTADLSAAIGRATQELEDRGTRFEYPFFGRDDLPIWIPSENVTEVQAQEGYQAAVEVLNCVLSMLSTNFGVDVA